MIEAAPLGRSHAAEVLRHGEPELAKRGGEERVVLEAIAAGVALEEFLLDRRNVDADHAVLLDLEVVERERAEVRDVESAKSVDGWRERPGHAESPEVVVESHALRSRRRSPR